MRHGAKPKGIEDAGGHVDGIVCATGPGHTIVTGLADTSTRDQAKLFNPVFLRGKGIPVPDWPARAFAQGRHRPPLSPRISESRRAVPALPAIAASGASC